MPGVYDVVVSYTEGGVTVTATYSICITKIKLPYDKTEKIEAEEIDFDLFPIFRP